MEIHSTPNGSATIYPKNVKEWETLLQNASCSELKDIIESITEDGKYKIPEEVKGDLIKACPLNLRSSLEDMAVYELALAHSPASTEEWITVGKELCKRNGGVNMENLEGKTVIEKANYNEAPPGKYNSQQIRDIVELLEDAKGSMTERGRQLIKPAVEKLRAIAGGEKYPNVSKEDDIEKILSSAVESEMAEDDNLTKPKAMEKVLSDQPELYCQYRQKVLGLN